MPLENKHPFNGLISRKTWVSWHQKGKIIRDFNEVRNDGVTMALAGPYANHLLGVFCDSKCSYSRAESFSRCYKNQPEAHGLSASIRHA